jgi:hypothetical protein
MNPRDINIGDVLRVKGNSIRFHESIIKVRHKHAYSIIESAEGYCYLSYELVPYNYYRNEKLNRIL